MGIKFAGVDIAKLVASNIGPAVSPVRLIRKTVGESTSGQLTGGRSRSSRSLGGRGFVSEYEDGDIDGTRIQRGDRQIILIAETFPGNPIPETGDQVFAENQTFTIVNDVKRDPAAATYTCQCRP